MKCQLRISPQCLKVFKKEKAKLIDRKYCCESCYGFKKRRAKAKSNKEKEDAKNKKK